MANKATACPKPIVPSSPFIICSRQQCVWLRVSDSLIAFQQGVTMWHRSGPSDVGSNPWEGQPFLTKEPSLARWRPSAPYPFLIPLSSRQSANRRCGVTKHSGADRWMKPGSTSLSAHLGQLAAWARELSVITTFSVICSNTQFWDCS